MFRQRSIQFRLTLWYTAILTAGLGLFGGLLWMALRQRLGNEFNQDLESRGARFVEYFTVEAAESSPAQLKDELDEFCQALPPDNSIEVRGTKGFVFRHAAKAPGFAGKIQTLRRQFQTVGDSYQMELTASRAPVDHTLDLVRLLLLSLIPLVILSSSLGGAWLSRRALQPVRDVTAAAHMISIENLSRRLPMPETGDDLAKLTEVLNTMLGRLDTAVKTLSQFVADASHELRTPLTVIHTTAQLALRRARSSESYRESIQEIAMETERMTQLVEDLLILARSDTGTAAMALEPLDVRESLREVIAEIRPIAEMSKMTIQGCMGGRPAYISGNRAALHRLFVVLLDNALKYSAAGGEVRVTVNETAGQVIVSIEDQGDGIRETDLPHIFKRFYRADPARSGGGYGLGLSLADSIARAHGASIEVRSTLQVGSVFRVAFPARVAGAESLGTKVKTGTA